MDIFWNCTTAVVVHQLKKRRRGGISHKKVDVHVHVGAY